MSTRREARERALGLCYEADVRGVDADVVLGELVAELDDRFRTALGAGTPLVEVLPGVDDETLDPYAVELVRGVAMHRDEIDVELRRFSEHWALERMPAIDRSLLRIGSYELLWQPDTPTGVVINEAVDLARQYSTKDSGRFVNGLLSRIAAERRGVA